ncbi:MAG TPA: hypothetical protein VK689_12880 [Armatimonadota bacterium]|nr:hypothetical protein [Armatimonadota bacterium]
MRTASGAVRGWAASLLLACCLAPLPAAAQGQAAGLRLEVTEIAQSVDLSRGKEKFMTVVVEITGADPARLRRVQPLRADFQLLAGKRALPCRWLRGGSLPEDPRRLRFTLGFSLPPPGTRKVSLQADLPRLEGADAVLELRLTGLQPGQSGQERRGAGWAVTVNQLAETEYVPPPLPPKGGFISKGGPVDARVFRKGSATDTPPARAVVLTIFSRDLQLYDPTLDVSGVLLAEGGASTPLLSASMRRDPSASVSNPPYRPFVTGIFHFRAPEKGRPTGVLLRLHRRPAHPERKPLRVDDLPVP